MIMGCRVLASEGVRFDKRVVREPMVSIREWKSFGWGVRLDSILSIG